MESCLGEMFGEIYLGDSCLGILLGDISLLNSIYHQGNIDEIIFGAFFHDYFLAASISCFLDMYAWEASAIV